jgi:hypothetical protein
MMTLIPVIIIRVLTLSLLSQIAASNAGTMHELANTRMADPRWTRPMRFDRQL